VLPAFSHMFGLSTNDKLKSEVSELRESVQRIEHAFKMLQVEWSETYDKFRQLHWRVAKRAKEAERLEGEQGSPQGEEAHAGGGGEEIPGLTPSQRDAQQKVLQRRNRKLVEARNGG
jgi:hypothetical protein